RSLKQCWRLKVLPLEKHKAAVRIKSRPTERRRSIFSPGLGKFCGGLNEKSTLSCRNRDRLGAEFVDCQRRRLGPNVQSGKGPEPNLKLAIRSERSKGSHPIRPGPAKEQ